MKLVSFEPFYIINVIFLPAFSALYTNKVKISLSLSNHKPLAQTLCLKLILTNKEFK